MVLATFRGTSRAVYNLQRSLTADLLFFPGHWSRIPLCGKGSVPERKLFTSALLGEEADSLKSTVGDFTMADSAPDPESNRGALWIIFFILDDRAF